MELTMHYRINEPIVVYELFKDEVVIIHFDSGNYYSLNGAGQTAWESLVEGKSLAEINQAITQQYEGEPAFMAASVSELFQELLAENLIVAEGSATGTGSITTVADNIPVSPFIKPELQKFTDMGDLLLLDPIHEVDESGWPNIKPE